MNKKEKSEEFNNLDRESQPSNPPRLDPYLKEIVDKYDKWLDEGTISYSSRVIPVRESFEANQWILPSEQVLEILKEARSIAVQNCVCRSRYKNCDHPLEVCFIFNETCEKYAAEGTARRVSLAEATEILEEANRAGLVHLSLYMPDHEVYALCSCCSCCCHDMQLIKKTGRKELMVRSEYIAVTDQDLCTDCGTCVERCVFEARALDGHNLVFDEEACMGCGLCITVCDSTAVRMITREKE